MTLQLHKLLARQFSRLNLNVESLPADLEQWQKFVTHINNVYIEADQERYILERSMEISSRELLDLNAKLENAQHVAHLGYFHYEKKSSMLILSTELYSMLGLDAANATILYEKFLTLVHDNDRTRFKECVKKTFLEGTRFEFELRIRNAKGEFRWYLIIGDPSQKNSAQLEYQLSGVAMDINTRKTAEEAIAELNRQLVTSARRAGMADVATSILHNVGNVLNSTNVSIELLQENLAKQNYNKLLAITKLMKENLPTQPDYLAQDPKGKMIPEYLISLADIIAKDQEKFAKEVANLNQNIQHIREIVAMQRSISGVMGIAEEVSLPNIIESALQMSGAPFDRHNITINKEFEDTPAILIDKTKLSQILINIIQNAKASLIADVDKNEKHINLAIKNTANKNEIIITVTDNGLGIAPENLVKMFTFGFTTKKDGHGFGLHSGALAAKEINGNLRVESDGLGQGATFILTLQTTPYTQ